jgi:hypothetical protein
MITRIMCVGPDRIYESMATLSFDHNLYPQPDKNIIITPYSEKEFKDLFKEFNINADKFTILDDSYFDQYYPDLRWWTGWRWYAQQAFKLCALDHFDSDYFLIQDCDLISLKPYSMIVSGKLNFKIEKIWNNYQHIYIDMVEKILGLRPTISGSLVNEIMPYSKQDWQELTAHIKQKHGGNFLWAISNVRPFDDKWFSEYEMLGIWKTNQNGWTYFTSPSQPKVDTWDEFYSINWRDYHSVKFHAPPLKFMNLQQAKDLVKFLRDIA